MESQLQTPIQEINLPTIENVDTADYRKHLEKLEIAESYVQSDTARYPVQNEEKPVKFTEFESELVSPTGSKPENSQYERSESSCAELKPTVSHNEEYKPLSSELPPVDWPKIIEAIEILWDPSYTPKQSAPDAYDGFIKYLVDKSSSAIKNNDPSEAKLYMDRLKSVEGSEAAQADLESRLEMQKPKQCLLMLRNGDISLARSLLASIQGPHTESSRIAVQIAIVNCQFRAIESLIKQGKIGNAFSMLKDIRDVQREWKVSFPLILAFESYIISGFVRYGLNQVQQNNIDLVQSLANTLEAFGHIDASRQIKLASINFHLDWIWDKIQTTQKDANTMDCWDEIIVNINRIDVLINWVVDLTPELPRKVDASDIKQLKPILERKYPAVNGLTAETLEYQLRVLREIKIFCQKWTLESIINGNWENAWAGILKLGQLGFTFQNDSRLSLPERSTTTEEKIWLVIGAHIATRMRRFKWAHKSLDAVSSQVESLDTDYQFLYHLTSAEVNYLKTRNMESALIAVRKALLFDGCKPCGTPKSDAYYLLVRILRRQQLNIDADYYWSLIPDYYDEWRIYGLPGKALQGREVKISEGRLDITLEQLEDIMEVLFKAPRLEELEVDSNSDLKALDSFYLLQGLYTDDILWDSSYLELKKPRWPEPTASRPLHLFAWWDRSDYLEIALNNPWIDVNQKNRLGQTALHIAAALETTSAITAKLLIDHNAMVDHLSSISMLTAFHYFLNSNASTSMLTEYIKKLTTLLSAKNAIDALGSQMSVEGNTPLHFLNDVISRELNESRKTSEISATAISRLQTYWVALDEIKSFVRNSGQAHIFSFKNKSGETAYDKNVEIQMRGVLGRNNIPVSTNKNNLIKHWGDTGGQSQGLYSKDLDLYPSSNTKPAHQVPKSPKPVGGDQKRKSRWKIFS